MIKRNRMLMILHMVSHMVPMFGQAKGLGNLFWAAEYQRRGPTNLPSEKEHHLPNLHAWVPC